jgi:hypothetical protein
VTSGRSLARFLLDEDPRPLDAAVGDRQLLLRRLLLAEVIAPPPALREPGTTTPLTPRGESGA